MDDWNWKMNHVNSYGRNVQCYLEDWKVDMDEYNGDANLVRVIIGKIRGKMSWEADCGEAKDDGNELFGGGLGIVTVSDA